MASFKKLWDILRKVNSCSLGILINSLILLAQGLLRIFPGDPRSWFPPTWFIFIFLFIAFL